MLLTSWVALWAYQRAGWKPQRMPKRILWLLTGMAFSGRVATV